MLIFINMTEEELAEFMKSMFVDYVSEKLSKEQKLSVEKFAKDYKKYLEDYEYYKCYLFYNKLDKNEQKKFSKSFKSFMNKV